MKMLRILHLCYNFRKDASARFTADLYAKTVRPDGTFRAAGTGNMRVAHAGHHGIHSVSLE